MYYEYRLDMACVEFNTASHCDELRLKSWHEDWQLKTGHIVSVWLMYSLNPFSHQHGSASACFQWYCHHAIPWLFHRSGQHLANFTQHCKLVEEILFMWSPYMKYSNKHVSWTSFSCWTWPCWVLNVDFGRSKGCRAEGRARYHSVIRPF